MRSDAATRPSWVSDELFPYDSKFVEIDGHVVHYVDEGSGPTLLMLHGNPTWSFLYRDVIGLLRTSFRCIALDYPGFGLSKAAPGYRSRPEDHAQVVSDFVHALDLSAVTLVGHDWGGPIGLAVAERTPGVVEGLVLANTWAWPMNRDLRAQLGSRVMGGLVGRQLIRRLNLFVNALMPAGHRLRKLSDAEMAHYRNALDGSRRNATATFARCIVGSTAFLAEVERGLPALASLPALILWGTADIAFGDRERRRWEAVFTGSQTVLVEGGGHFVQSDAPEQFASAIRDWHAGR